jgi:4-carboxymuconolactone decarboxylase
MATSAAPDAGATLHALDGETAALVAAAAVVTAGDEQEVREALRSTAGRVRAAWIEELILQSYLFAGFPRALNAMRSWRTVSSTPAPPDDDPVRAGGVEAAARAWTERGLRTCATVYGPFYEPLRVNIAALHPALDAWMIEEGYGKVLGRPVLDLARRELCVVAACIAARQDRQLHSHLHGAVHAGAAPEVVTAAVEVAVVASRRWLDDARADHYRQLWTKVQAKGPAATAAAVPGAAAGATHRRADDST